MINISTKTKIVFLAALSACLIYGLSSGFRANYGVMLQSIVSQTGVSYSGVSLVAAIGQLIVGIVQPIFGGLALKRTNSFVLIIGLVLLISGLFLLPFSHSFMTLLLTLGLLISGGIGALSFGIVMAAVTPIIGIDKAATVSGFVSASSGVGGIILSPGIETLEHSIGLTQMLWLMTIPFIFLLIICFFMGKNEVHIVQGDDDTNVSKTILKAFKNRNYIFITLAFFTCGFHMSIIETHLFSQFMDYGYSSKLIALAFSLYGLAAMLGSIFSGFMLNYFKAKWVLFSLYFSRMIIPLLILIPSQSVFILFFSLFLLGFTGNATVPPTSSLIVENFDIKKLGILFGLSFLVHQVGAFTSSWLGGLFFEWTHSYRSIWLISIVLSAIASFMISSIKEKSVTL